MHECMTVTSVKISYITINILILYLRFNFRLPLACDIIFRNKKYFLFIKWCLISLGGILVSANYSIITIHSILIFLFLLIYNL